MNKTPDHQGRPCSLPESVLDPGPQEITFSDLRGAAGRISSYPSITDKSEPIRINLYKSRRQFD